MTGESKMKSLETLIRETENDEVRSKHLSDARKNNQFSIDDIKITDITDRLIATSGQWDMVWIDFNEECE